MSDTSKPIIQPSIQVNRVVMKSNDYKLITGLKRHLDKSKPSTMSSLLNEIDTFSLGHTDSRYTIDEAFDPDGQHIVVYIH